MAIRCSRVQGPAASHRHLASPTPLAAASLLPP
eukprot:CAMPEP_0181238022 /NCGR_PEP_ID=MMETSP1096-20121128/39097_1 /TAXON_ID=156174 ORGANISM="Chrysochromulina ericina, Strain CCMP281" /NCGR_SAMPLE_ID=MMETSP1096 /ASSEMBLY_ACC=CAM_ASM_000453 /LENGTH=32 /DNA_ID= /DNA_START= /DNA_END= /DNA_ORIENTATION=